MKILFLHLSDSHIRNKSDLQVINIDAIEQSLRQVGYFDECILVFSGDIVFGGDKESYNLATKLVITLAKKISKTYLQEKIVHTIVVPGNHDNLVVNKKRTNIELENFYKTNVQDIKFYEDISMLDNFYDFASKNKCFSRKKVIDIKYVNFGDFSIRFNMINTAPFSLLGEGNQDKGLHYIPKKELNTLINKGNQKYTVTVLHHSPEWFCDNSKHALYNYINENTDLLFLGHEHFGLNENKYVNEKHIDVSSGIALYGTNSEQGYNVLLMDTEAHTLTGYKYTRSGNIYKPTLVISDKNIVFRTNSKFRVTKEFQRELVSDSTERDGENYTNYFIFPSLEVKDASSEVKDITINNENRFLELLYEKRRIAIEGGSRAGKTILSKYLSKKLLEKYTVLYLNEDSFGPKLAKNILKNAFYHEYGDNADLDEFLQLSNEKKVLIVDGSDKVSEKWSYFLEEYGEQFLYIITFCGVDWNIDIKNKAIEKLTEKEFYRLSICPFYYIKREELIKKICNNYAQDNLSINVEEKSRKINEEITNQIRYFQLTPDFIHQFVDFYLQFPHIKTPNETNVFSKVFEANISYRISNNIKEESDVDEIFVALDYVAHFIHFVKKYQRISFQEFEQAINEYKERYDNNELSSRYVYDVAKKSNIIKESVTSFEVEFCDENLLAFFVAKHLNRSCQMGENLQDLKDVLDNICFGINGDIILFLSYITSNTQILSPILNSITSHMEKWDELNIDQNNIEYLSKTSKPIVVKIPDKEEKERIKQQKNKIEKELVAEKNNQSDSLYSYDVSKVNSFNNKVVKSINYLQLVAKILPSFRHILTGEEKEKITNILYSYPNKLLYFMLKDIDDNYSHIIEEILKKEPRTRKGLLITEEMLTREFQNQSIGFILSIYDFISTTASTQKTIGDLEKFDFSHNTNYRIQNLMMQENVANFKIFAKRAEDIYDNTKYNIIKQMVNLIVRKYYMYHNVELHGDAVRIIDKFFGADQRRNVQIQQAKNMIIKK